MAHWHSSSSRRALRRGATVKIPRPCLWGLSKNLLQANACKGGMPALRFKTCRLLEGNVWNRKLTIIQRRILRRLRNKTRSIKRMIYSRKNLNSYIQLQTTRKLPLDLNFIFVISTFFSLALAFRLPLAPARVFQPYLPIRIGLPLPRICWKTQRVPGVVVVPLFPSGRASKRLHHVKLQATDWLQGTLEEEQWA